eukprot:scaffold2243_cov165-Amphora_coffeaeformis.AAC.5
MRKTAFLLSSFVACAAAFAPSPTSFSLDRKTPGRAVPFRHRILFVSQQQQQQQLERDEAKKTRSDMQVPLEYNDNIITTTASPSEDGNLLWRGVVVVLCAVWASNFAAIKLVVAEPGVDSSLYAVARFGLATASLIPFAFSKMRGSDEVTSDSLSLPPSTGMDAETLKGAIICGSWVAFGYIGQLLGLLTTTASKSCVICSLHCVFVAAVAELWRTRETKKPYDVRVLAPAALAVMGVSIVELWGASNGANIGDVLSFAQPIGFGMGYLQLENLMAKRPDLALPVSAIKLAMVTLASLFYFEVGPLLSHGAAEWTLRLPDFGPILSSPTALGGVLYTGLVTTALALWVESIAFARVAATDASLILTTEPLFAAAFGAVALGETFGGSDYLGAACIIGACVLAALMEDTGEECIILDEPIDGEEELCEPKSRWTFWGL